MARQRAKKHESKPDEADTSFNPSEFDPAMQEAAAQNHAAAASEAPPEHGQASHAHRHAPARDKTPGYRGVHTDHLTGVTTAEHKYPFLAILRFAEKPSDAVRTVLRDAGFEWGVEGNKEWSHPIPFDRQFEARENHRRTYDAVRKIIRAERGITHSVGAPQ